MLEDKLNKSWHEKETASNNNYKFYDSAKKEKNVKPNF